MSKQQQNNIPPSSPPLWQIKLNLGTHMPEGTDWTDESAGKLAEFFEDFGDALSIRKDDDSHEWFIEVICNGEPDRRKCNVRLGLYQMVMEKSAAGIELSFEQLPDIDWLEHVYEQFPPRTIGRFFVHGTHVRGQCPKGLVPLEINAATAFGSGEHATTQGCLQAYHDLLEAGESFSKILDLGCGSGILAIAAALVCGSKAKIILASDFDEESIEKTREHAAMNGVENQVRALVATGYDDALIADHAPYDLIFANILAGPLIDLAAETVTACAKGGVIILSGMLSEQSPAVEAAHKEKGFSLLRRITLQEWDTLVMRKA